MHRSANERERERERERKRERERSEFQVVTCTLYGVTHPLCSFHTFLLSLSLSLSPFLKPGSQSGGRPQSSSVGAGNRAGVLEIAGQSESEECYGGETGVNQGQWFISSLSS